ncbi:reverse transcriptase domain-containing protein [Paenibacillus polysaccharolyticus]|uniref:reverse transcriptase domain-containing protein n=1 Tax=Paenibacillus polysaccharolyticus TaxID=582692 RepID=UPI00209DA548|nr:reverse transcriptase domain-containing protein [Paenibacillus polysaccharolyticus]MCP1133296.1 reverse transcriptase domain-containing protein [Paenibacillus polysaccharolyticus]
MSSINNVYDFILRDFQKTLFPLRSTLLLSKFNSDHILQFVNNEIFSQAWFKTILSDVEYAKVSEIMNEKQIKKINQIAQSYFLIQPWVYALKDKNHYRQTFQLDPVAHIFIYDFVFRNRSYFQKQMYSNRESFGYTFNGDSYNSQSEEYKNFLVKLKFLKSEFDFMGKIDISNFFNNIYHHDVVSYIARLINQQEAEKIGKFLREINEGRSTSCMPQGLFPMKVVGSNFLSFIEASRELKSEYIIRFMDDIYFFSNNEETIKRDIFNAQRILGEKGLSLNEEKTGVFSSRVDRENDIETVKVSLLEKRRMVINSYTDEFDDDNNQELNELTEVETEFLHNLLQDVRNIEDEDIELILSLLMTSESDTIKLTKLVLYKSPQLMKNLYYNIKRNYMRISDSVITEIESYLEKTFIPEYQLFWITKIIVDFTALNESIADLLNSIYRHTSVTNIVKCLILEVPENNYGFLELKKTVARGHAPELIISAMVGLLSHEKSNRNQIYKYVAKSNSMLRTIISVLYPLEVNSHEMLLEDLDEKYFIKHTYVKNDSNSGNIDPLPIVQRLLKLAMMIFHFNV